MEIIRVVILSGIAGVVGMVIGGLLCLAVKKPSNKLMFNMFSLASGLMLGISFLSLLPEAIEIGNIYIAILGVAIGAAMIILIEKYIHSRVCHSNSSNNTMNKTALIIFISIALHNIPEGLAIGGSAGLNIGFITALSIGLHNIPEGMAIGLPMKVNKMKGITIIKYCALTGVPTIFGGIIGYYMGEISSALLSLSLSLAAGAMFTVVFLELLPEAEKYADCSRRGGSVAYNLLGIMLIALLINIL